MGKRKSRISKLTVAPKKAQKLDEVFTCPFCCYPEAVECHIDRKDMFAEASCRICSVNYFTSVNALTEPVDVYCEWIDACEKANEDVVVRRCKPRLGHARDYEDDV